jgi:hypothetical protein
MVYNQIINKFTHWVILDSQIYSKLHLPDFVKGYNVPFDHGFKPSVFTLILLSIYGEQSNLG